MTNTILSPSHYPCPLPQNINSNFGLVGWIPGSQPSRYSNGYQDMMLLGNNPAMVAQGTGTGIAVDGVFRDGGLTIPSGSTGYFDKSTSPTQYPLGTTTRTVTCWVEVPNFNNYFIPFSYGNPLTNYHGGWLAIMITTGKIAWGVTGADAISGGTISTNTPAFIAVAAGGTNNNLSQVSLWINAVSQSISLDAADGALDQGLDGPLIGRIQTTTYGPGSVWDIRLYNRRLSDADMMQLYAEGSFGATTRSSQALEMPALSATAGAASADFRRTLSHLGTRTGSRQVHWI